MSDRFLDFCERHLKWILPAVFVCTAVMTAGVLTVRGAGAGQKVTLSYITAEYVGDTKAGTVLDSDNTGFIVTAHNSDGTTAMVTGWSIEEPQTLQNAEDTTVVIVYEGASTQCTVHCSTGYVSSITAEYDGETAAGTSLDDTNPGIHVYVIRSTGEKVPLERGWHVVKPALLSKGKTTTIQIAYEDHVCTLSVDCSTREIKKLTAVYSGSTEEGTFIGSGNDDMTVTAWYSDEESEEVTGWTVSEGVTLEPRERYLIEVHYQDTVCLVEVVCTTPTREEYAAACSSPGYLPMRTLPASYAGQQVMIDGTIREIHLREDGSVMITVDVQADLFGFVQKPIIVRYTSTLHGELPPEGSEVTVYGVFNGLFEEEGALENAPFIEGEYVISQEQ